MKTCAEKQIVPKKPPRNDALEAIDFIINVLKEHEKDLDRLITELGKITDQLGETGEVSEKIDKIEERLFTIQTEVANLIKFLSAPQREEAPPPTAGSPTYTHGPPVIVKCKNWEDFKTLAKTPETLSYTFTENEKDFQADALKEGRVLTYSGQLPQNTKMLKTWLSRQLNIEEERIFEGILALR